MNIVRYGKSESYKHDYTAAELEHVIAAQLSNGQWTFSVICDAGRAITQPIEAGVFDSEDAALAAGLTYLSEWWASLANEERQAAA